ncbi:hypothetical protein [Brevibacillus fluminis]|nr:hypothetical protein [Brevibacillus fluminis]
MEWMRIVNEATPPPQAKQMAKRKSAWWLPLVFVLLLLDLLLSTWGRG